MSATDDLPTDSVLRRHAITKRNRSLGLPPTEAVLRRHHDRWMSVLLASPVTFAPSSNATPAATPMRAAQSSTASSGSSPAEALAGSASASGGGGLMGWLRRLFGG
jgi:hypothetical protein